MTNASVTSGVLRLSQARKGLYVDVRGLPCPEPLVTVLRLIDGGDAGELVFAHLSQEPLLLYPELDERGWGYRMIAASDEMPLPDGEVVLELSCRRR
jgi:hypothetical protein